MLKLYEIMDASGVMGRLLGSTKLKLICDEIPNVLNYQNDDLYDRVIEIKGFADITTKKFVDNLPKFIIFFNKLMEIYDLNYLIYDETDIENETKEESKKELNKKINGKSFVLTGFRDEKIKNYVEDNNGSIKTSISKNTNYLIYSDDSSSKYIKAQELGIPCILREDFFKYFK